MSGHSKWAKIKRQKGANDAKRGALFTKLAKTISLAASEGGGDPDMNFTLRLAIDKAKQANMPMDNVERAIKRGTGEDKSGEQITRINYEGIGPNASAFIVKCSTNNLNRTVAEIRKLFEQVGGNLGTTGSVSWQFEEKGSITIFPEKLQKSETFGKEDLYIGVDIDELQLELMEVEGIKDIKNYGETLEIITDKNDFAKVHKEVEQMGIRIDNAELRFIPNDELQFKEDEQEKVLGFMENLDEHDDVENVFTNVNLD